MTSQEKEIKEGLVKQGVIMALVKGREILLEERTEPGITFFGYNIVPGGGIKGKESPEDALRRELLEERDIVPTAFRSIGEIREIEGGGVLNIRHVFLITGFEREVVNAEGRNKPFWATLDQAEEICVHPISQKILDLVRTAIGEEELRGG